MVLLLLAACLAFFTFGTERGARFTFDRIVALTEGRLSVGSVAGRLPAPLTLTDVRYRDPAAGMDVTIRRLVIDVGATAALSRRAVIESLEATGVAVKLTTVASDPANESPWQPPLDFIVERASVDGLTIEQDGEPLPRFDRIEIAGEWTEAGIAVRRFDARGPDGRLDLAGEFASARGHRGRARGTFAWRIDGTAWAGELDAASDGRNARAIVALRAPMAARVVLSGVPADDALPWRLSLDAPPFDPAALGLGDCGKDGAAAGADAEPCPRRIEAVSAKLEGSGTREQFSLAGDLTLDAHRVRLERFEGAWREGVLTLDALRVSSPDAAGSLDATGEVRTGGEGPAEATLALEWREVVIPAELAGRTLATHGTASFEGSAESYAARGRFAFGPPDRVADIDVVLSGDAERIVFESLKLVQPQGGLDATGTLTLGAEPSWKIDATASRFDPGAFLADWPGVLDFTLSTAGTRREAGIDATLDIDGLAGELRGRAVAGEADLVIRPGNVVEGTATLRSGESRVALVGRGGAETDVAARVDIATLADFFPGSAGAVEGDVAARGTWPALDVDADLAIRNLFHRGTRVRSATLRADVANLEDPSGTVSLAAQDVEIAAGRFDTLTLEADGSAAQHRIALDAAGDDGVIALALDGSRTEAGWRGVVPKLELALRGAALALESPAQVDYADGVLALAESCFAVTQTDPGEPARATAAGAGRACVASETAADRSTRARYRVERVPIALVVAVASPGAPLRTEGVLDGSGSFSRSAEGAWSGNGTLGSAAGLVAYPDTSEQPLLRYTGLALDAQLAPGRTRATARAAFDEGGSLDGTLTVDDGALGGRVDLVVKSLRFIELLTPEVANPRGTLEAHYTLGGTTREPRLDGALSLAGFAAEIPAAGLELEEGRATLRAAGSDRYALTGSVRSGEGTITLRGDGGLGADAPMRIEVRGERVLAADIPGVKVVASPELTLTRADGTMRLRGKVTLPSASVNLARLPGGGATQASRDVVVIDEAATSEAKAAAPLDTDVTIVLGDAVKVRGYGLDGEVEGQLRVRERPGRAATGTGQIRIAGKYRAYGQNLTIERGRLLFAQSPLDDPGLDIRAVRKLREVTPGLRIAGTAKAPVLTVFSEPPMEQGNALSYLVTGRPLRSLSGEDGDTVGMAARALGTATGDLLAKSIGAKMGVDDIGVAESDALGGAAFTVGKYLSPRLYVSYGVGVFDPGTVVTMRYTLTDNWELEASSGTVENRAGVNYKFERD